jgi:hypothetical protein
VTQLEVPYDTRRQEVPPMRHTRIRGNTMDFSQALRNLKDGDKVARAGWNGRGMWLLYASGGTFKVNDQIEGDLIEHIVMKTAQDNFVPWLASQTDILADDWEVVA